MLQEGTRFFTSESVTEGHPDKVCDQISDAILDAHLAQDPMARVACETIATTGMVLVMGEITTSAYVPIESIVRQKVVDYNQIVRDTIARIGYKDGACGFDARTCAVQIVLDQQSADIAMGVNDALEERGSGESDNIGAGDQGMMFGYACNETEELMPMPIALSHRLAKKLAEVRKSGELPYLRPDGKSQVTVEYENGKPKRIEAVVLSTQHSADVEQKTIREDLIKKVVDEIIPQDLLDENTKYFINPTGRFVIGGPEGDSGLTGRKIIVDTYGGYAPHGGGAFSGKDASKVDRSGAYMARYIAKNIVAAKLAKRCLVSLAYAIGVAEPVAISVDTYGTGAVPDDELLEAVKAVFDCRPAIVCEDLGLYQPIFTDSTNFGHFGKDYLPWEETDRAGELLDALGR